MAIQVIEPLTAFCESVGLTRDKWKPDHDLAEFMRVTEKRKAQTIARYRRRVRRARRSSG
jgi:hypothetical protein